ncbi:MAG: 16S rRNA (uracil(1498)-N(3))-methyltransferase [Prevotella sp.]|nr:16S rRNA (uracil(1498)-N(3))-methyltransferase [Prevotella sp.]
MKESRYFYVPNAAEQTELPLDEAMHALRVLRLKSGDEMFLMDGEGNFYQAEVTIAATKRCLYAIKQTLPQQKDWRGRIHIAMAPTKMMDRVEWFVEKATEIGIDEFSFLNCKFSERKVMRTVRLDKIVVSAIKQSRKPWKPVVNQMVSFKEFLQQPHTGHCFIAHCYEEVEREDFYNLVSSPAIAQADDDITILIGPEGDFSIDEVKMAMNKGFKSITLGNARLRTETAALSATMMAQLARRLG